MNKESKFLVENDKAGMPISEFVHWAMNTDRKFDFDASAMKKLFSENRVRVNGKLMHKMNYSLQVGETVSIFIKPKQAPKQQIKEFYELQESQILYEDVVLMILNKPSGLPTQGTTDPTRDHLFAAAKRFLDKRSPNRDNYLGLHHRLDRDTSGVILMCKKKSANKACQELFTEKTAKKTYWAICHKTKADYPKREWQIKNFLTPDTSKKMRMKVAGHGDLAITDCKVLQDFGDYLLIEARPHTGRMHQIRVHLSSQGFPLVGDSLYTDISLDKALKEKTQLPTNRTLLHAFKLEFPHPINSQEMEIKAPIPADFDLYLKNIK